MATQIGINLNPFFVGTVENTIADTITFQLLAANKVKSLRLSINLTDDALPIITPRFASMVALGALFGIELQPVLFTPFWYGDATDGGRYPSGDLYALFQSGYNRVKAFVSQFTTIKVWELGNETNLKQLGANGQPLFGLGQTAAEFDTPLMNQYAAVIHGMSEAIKSLGTARRLIGFTTTNVGYLLFMQRFGAFDASGYHLYDRKGINLNAFWNGALPPWDLFATMNSFGFPTYFNEVGSAGVYDATFINDNTSPTMAAAAADLDWLMAACISAGVTNMAVYSGIDNPSQTGVEGHFGMLFANGTDKLMAPIYRKYSLAQI